VDVLAGASLVEAAGRAGTAVDMPCGGAGTCGKCRVRVDGAEAPEDAELNAFSAGELAQGWRLACRQRIMHDVTVVVPESSVFGGRHQILTDHDTGTVHDLEPEVRQARVRMRRPTLEDGMPDLVRIEEALRASGAWNGEGVLKASPATLHRTVAALRDGGYEGWALLRDGAMLGYHPGETRTASHALAFDIGTTTLAGVLLDLADGTEKAVVARMNPQTTQGDDVISRISHAVQGEDGLRELRRAVTAAVGEMAAELCREAGVVPGSVHAAAFSGNTTMEHLLCGIDPAPLSMVPFVPVFGRGLSVLASELGLAIHPEARAYVFPVIGGFVGGDTVAGLLATALPERAGATLFVDVGTNGEIVLSHCGRLWAASTAAGPAFEGARISCGMRAAEGAIEKVVIDERVHLGVIGAGTPAGLCGSGLVDLCGQLLKCGALGGDGRLPAPENLPADIPADVAARFRRDAAGEMEFVLSEDGPRRVSLTQRDVRELQLAAGAIRAGISILLRQAGLDIGQVAQVLVAGGFGSFIRRDNAQRIGLLPPELPHDRIVYIGNASLAGAKWAALSRRARARAEVIARLARHVELSNDPDFAMEFAMAMYFPG
jgi:uncharacterized 2Fe-2S/4Fe-4S cluster protein (DUF4445 family)